MLVLRGLVVGKAAALPCLPWAPTATPCWCVRCWVECRRSVLRDWHNQLLVAHLAGALQ